MGVHISQEGSCGIPRSVMVPAKGDSSGVVFSRVREGGTSSWIHVPVVNAPFVRGTESRTWRVYFHGAERVPG